MEEFEFEGSLECLFKQLDDARLELIPGLVRCEQRRRLKRASTASIDSDAKKSRPSSLSTSEPSPENDSPFEDSKICDVPSNRNTGPSGNSYSSPGRISTSSILSNQPAQNSPPASTPARKAGPASKTLKGGSISTSGPKDSPDSHVIIPTVDDPENKPKDNYMCFGFASGRKVTLRAEHTAKAASMFGP